MTAAAAPLAALARALGPLAPGLALRLAEPTAHGLGRLGEDLAARAVRREGWRLVARRLRTDAGELDVVALRGRELRVIEVKTRRAPARASVELAPFRPADAIDARRRARLERAAASLAARLGARGWRIAAAEVWVTGPERRAEVRIADLATSARTSASEVSFPGQRRSNR